MKKLIMASTAIIIGSFLTLAQFAFGHHSFAMFDNSKERIIEGTVVRWAFNNPHTWLYIEAADENGEMITWGFEGAAQVHAMRQGVNGTTFQPGERVKVIMQPLVSGEPAGAMCFVQKKMAPLPVPMMVYAIQKPEPLCGSKMAG